MRPLQGFLRVPESALADSGTCADKLVPAVGFFDRRELREVTLDARGEVVRIGVLDDPKRRLPLRALALPAGVRTDVDTQPCLEPRPLRADNDRDCQREQGDVEPAHDPILAKPNGG